jgi:transposase
MARKLEIEWQHDASSLEALYRAEKDGKKRTRLHALWLLRQGKSMCETAGLLAVHYRTVQEWLHWYRRGGVAEVLAHPQGGQGGPVPRLTPEQEQALVEQAKTGQIRTIADGVAWVWAQYQVHYSYWGMRWVFVRLKLRLKVPRPRNPKASAEIQAAWQKGGSRQRSLRSASATAKA